METLDKMKIILVCLAALLIAPAFVFAGSDSSKASVLIIPYMPAMHLSDADQDISEGSELNPMQMRAALRNGLLKSLNNKFAEVYDARSVSNDFVAHDESDNEFIYHTLFFKSDSIWPSRYPSRFAVKDTSAAGIRTKFKKHVDNKFINVGIRDAQLLDDLSEKYSADYFLFLNEIDIKTNFDDCINLAMKIYNRDIKIHYSIFDRSGKQIYGDVASSHFPSNANDVNEIMAQNFPSISAYVLNSFQRAKE
jgi:hypothetical protein